MEKKERSRRGAPDEGRHRNLFTKRREREGRERPDPRGGKTSHTARGEICPLLELEEPGGERGTIVKGATDATRQGQYSLSQ